MHMEPMPLLPSSSCISEGQTKLTWTSKKVAEYAEPWKMYTGQALSAGSAVRSQETCCHWLPFYEFSLEKLSGPLRAHELPLKKTNGSKFSRRASSCTYRAHPVALPGRLHRLGRIAMSRAEARAAGGSEDAMSSLPMSEERFESFKSKHKLWWRSLP